MRRVLLICACALASAAPAGANDYVGTLATGGSASIAGTLIKCKAGGGGLGCALLGKGGTPNLKAWAFTINDSVVQVGQISSSKAAYTSPKQPKTSGAAFSNGVRKLRVK